MKIFSRFAEYAASRVEVPHDKLEALRDELARGSGPVVYVTRRPSYFETAVLSRVLALHGLPAPSHIVSPFRRVGPPSGQAVLAALRWRTGHETSLAGVRRYRSRLTKWLEERRKENARFVPLALFAGLGPRPWPHHSFWPIDFTLLPLGDVWLLFVYWFHRRSLRMDVGSLIKSSAEHSGSALQTLLSREIYRREKVARGAKARAPDTVESIVLSGERFEAALFELAEETSASRTQLYRTAQKYLHDMAGSFRGGIIMMLWYIIHPVVSTVFSHLRLHNFEVLKEATAKSPVVLLPSHRSHFDYILMSYLLYTANLPLPYVAAGINLNFWPFGPIAKGAGAFFIRRAIDDDPLYKIVLDNYIGYLTKQGHMLEFFIEGGRSRSGAMRRPRLGLLKYLIRSWEQGGREDVALVPIGITYERLAEETALFRELKGASKRRETLLDLLRLHRIRRKRFGSATAVVGAPISLKDFYEMRESEDAGGERLLMLVTEDLGYTLARRIMDSTALTGTSLASAALFSMPDYRCSTGRAVGRMISLLQVIFASRGLNEAGSWNAQTRLSTDAEGEVGLVFSAGLQECLASEPLGGALAAVLGRVETFELVSEVDVEEHILAVPADKRLRVEYYKNNLMHLLIKPAALMFSLRAAGVRPAEELYYFHQRFKAAFLFPFWRHWRLEIEQTAAAMSAAGLLECSDDLRLDPDDAAGSIGLSEAGAALLQPLLWLIIPFFEARCAGLQALLKTSYETCEEERLVRQIIEILQDSEGFSQPTRTESAAITTVELAIDSILQDGLVSVERGGGSGSARVRSLAPAAGSAAQTEIELANAHRLLAEMRAVLNR